MAELVMARRGEPRPTTKPVHRGGPAAAQICLLFVVGLGQCAHSRSSYPFAWLGRPGGAAGEADFQPGVCREGDAGRRSHRPGTASHTRLRTLHPEGTGYYRLDKNLIAEAAVPVGCALVYRTIPMPTTQPRHALETAAHYLDAAAQPDRSLTTSHSGILCTWHNR